MVALRHWFFDPKSNNTSRLLTFTIYTQYLLDSSRRSTDKMTISSVICSGGARNFFLVAKPLPPPFSSLFPSFPFLPSLSLS